MQRPRVKPLFLYSFITSVAVSAVIGIAVILLGDFGEFETMVLLTALTVTVTSILGLACGAYLETRRGRVIPVSGIVLALVSAVLWIYLIWHGTVQNDIFVKSLLSATVLAASCAHVSLLSLARLDRRFLWSRVAVHVVVWALAAFLLFLIWNPTWIDEQYTGRIIGVLSLLIAALTVLTPVFHKLSAAEQTVEEMDAEIERLQAKIQELELKKATTNRL